jgi:hypothetical protein
MVVSQLVLEFTKYPNRYRMVKTSVFGGVHHEYRGEDEAAYRRVLFLRITTLG